MFERKNNSYDIDWNNIDRKKILADEANPLVRIYKSHNWKSKRVLDVGCGNGYLGWLLNHDAELYGIEPNKYASGLAKKYYKKIFNQKLEDFVEENQGVYFDFIVLADVIEHIPYPQNFLKSIAKLANDKTVVYFSVPNVTHFSIKAEILQGFFNYQKSGILESTHLRFYTQESFSKMLMSNNFYIYEVHYLIRFFVKFAFQRYRLIVLLLLFRSLLDKNSLSYQYLYMVKMQPSKTKNIVRLKTDIKFLLTRFFNLVK